MRHTVEDVEVLDGRDGPQVEHVSPFSLMASIQRLMSADVRKRVLPGGSPVELGAISAFPYAIDIAAGLRDRCATDRRHAEIPCYLENCW